MPCRWNIAALRYARMRRDIITATIVILDSRSLAMLDGFVTRYVAGYQQ